MTIEAWTRADVALIQTAGPFTIPHPYTAGAITATVIRDDGSRVALVPGDYTLVPEASADSGSLMLTPEAFAAWQGAMLEISRATPVEQGWQGLLGERERGLERQLDAMVMAQQETALGLSGAVRARTPLDPITPRAFGYLRFDEDGQPQVTDPLPDLSAINDAIVGNRTRFQTIWSGDGTSNPLPLPFSGAAPEQVFIVINKNLLTPGKDFTVEGFNVIPLPGGDYPVWPIGTDNIYGAVDRAIDLAAITSDDVTHDDRPLSEVLASLTSVSVMDLGAWLARHAPTDWIFASQGVTAGQNPVTVTAAVQAFWAEVVNRAVVNPGFVHVIRPAANILLADEEISEATAQLIWDNTPNGRTDRGVYVEDRGLQVTTHSTFPAQRVRTSGLYAEQGITYPVPCYVFRWEQSGGAQVLRRWSGKTEIIGRNNVATDPGGIRLFRVNGLMAPDGFAEVESLRRHTAIDIDQCQNMRWGPVKVGSRTGWQPTEVGAGNGLLSGTVRFSVTGTTIEATEAVFKPEDVGKWFCVDRCGPAQNNGGFDEEDPSGTADNRIAWWSTIAAYVSPTQVQWTNAPPANVALMTGSFPAIRFSCTAGNTAMTLSAPVATSLVGCQIIPYGAGVQARGIAAGLCVPVTVIAHTGASITVSHAPLRNVTNGALIVTPQRRLVQTAEGLQRTETKRCDDIWFTADWTENGGTGGQACVPLVIGRGEGIWITGKLHGASPRVANNFGGNFANLILGRADAIMQVQSSHGMNSPFFGKVMANGDKLHLRLDGVSAAWTAPTHSAEFWLDPDAPEFTDHFTVYDGQHSRMAGFPNVAVGQAFVRGGANFRSGLIRALGSTQPALGRVPVFPDHEFAGTIAHAYGSSLARLRAAFAAGWRPGDVESGVVYECGGLQFLGQTGATNIPDLPGLIPIDPTPYHYGVEPDGVTDIGWAVSQAFLVSDIFYIPPIRKGGPQWACSTPMMFRGPRQTIQGMHEDRSRIRDLTGGTVPLICFDNYADPNAAGYERCTVRKIFIDELSVPSRPTRHTIDLCNAVGAKIENVTINAGLVGTETCLYGAIAGKRPGSTYSGEAWMLEALGNTFLSARLEFHSSDNIVLGGFYYGYTREKAVQLGGGTVFLGVTTGGGTVYGAVYLRSEAGETMFSVKVVACHCDGNNTNRSRYFIFAPASQLLASSLVQACHSWNLYDQAVRIENGEGCEVIGNIFRQGDSDDRGVADLYLSGVDCWIDSNIHRRIASYPKPVPGGTRTQKSDQMVVVNTDRSRPNIIGRVITNATVPGPYRTRFVGTGTNPKPQDWVALNEDFLTPNSLANFTLTKGSNGVAALPAKVAAQNGVVRLQYGTDIGGTHALNASQLLGDANWRASDHGLEVMIRKRMTLAVNQKWFAGLTVGTGLHMPITENSGVYSASVADAVGFLYSAAGAAVTLVGIGVRNNVLTAALPCLTLAGNTFYDMRIEVLNGGRAIFMVNGTWYGELANAVTATALLAPIVTGFSTTTGSKAGEVDYINLGQWRT